VNFEQEKWIKKHKETFALSTLLELSEFRFKWYNLPKGKSLQLRNSPVDCARELFKMPKDSASLLVHNDKKFKFCFFLWVMS